MKQKNTFCNSITEISQGLLQFLEEKGYAPLTLHNYQFILHKLSEYMESNSLEYYSPELNQKFYDSYVSEKDIHNSRKSAIKTVLARLRDYYYQDEFRLNHQKKELPVIIPELKEAIEKYLSYCRELGNKTYTLKHKKYCCYDFLEYAYSLGGTQLSILDPSTVGKCCSMITNKDKWAIIRDFLHFLVKANLTQYDLSTLVPKYNRPTSLPTTYSVEEIHRLESAVDRRYSIGKRDYAIILLATRLGMRSGDIVKLRFNELDFMNNSIQFIQEKTHEELKLPLLPDIKESLLNYINNARPASSEPYVFLRCNPPFQKISTSVIRFETTKYFRLAGIDIDDKKHGPHTLRASLANSMVNDDVPYETVRKVLGHTDPDAIKHYAELDIERLRMCSLEVPAPSGSFMRFLEGGASL